MRTHIAALTVVAALALPFDIDARVAQASDVTAALPIVGAWTLNHALSSRPPEPGTVNQGRAEGGRRGGFGGGGGVGGRGGGGMGQRSDTDRLRMLATLRRLRDAPERLTITYDGRTVAFADGDGRTWKATTDGRKQTILTGDGEIDLKAHLDGAQLIVEETISGKNKLVYTYAPAEDAGIRRLSVQVKLEGGNGGRAAPEMTRVYDTAQ